MSGKPLEISPTLLKRVFAEARQAFPAECCGWLTGDADQATALRPCVNAQAQGEHPTAEDRGADTAYVIAGDDLLAFSKAFDDPAPPRVIYHSHPNGRAYFSDTDRKVAMSPWGDGPTYPVQQLVVGIDAHRVTEAALFGWSGEREEFVELMRLRGEER